MAINNRITTSIVLFLICLIIIQEKEKDLEVAAKIGQELLERNKSLDDNVSRLENDLAGSQELITQLNHELQVSRLMNYVWYCGGSKNATLG